MMADKNTRLEDIRIKDKNTTTKYNRSRQKQDKKMTELTPGRSPSEQNSGCFTQ
jgi:hypothetical protein